MGQYVRFTEAELESLETESSNSIDLKEFVPLSKIDPVYFDTPYYLEAAKARSLTSCLPTRWPRPTALPSHSS